MCNWVPFVSLNKSTYIHITLVIIVLTSGSKVSSDIFRNNSIAVDVSSAKLRSPSAYNVCSKIWVATALKSRYSLHKLASNLLVFLQVDHHLHQWWVFPLVMWVWLLAWFVLPFPSMQCLPEPNFIVKKQKIQQLNLL